MATGLAKAGGSGFLGGALSLLHHANPLDTHGYAEDLDMVTGLGSYGLNRLGVISDKQAAKAVKSVQDFRHSLPLGLGATPEEEQRALHLYYEPQTRAEQIVNTGASVLPGLLVGGEGVAETGAQAAARQTARALAKQAARRAAQIATETGVQTGVQEGTRALVQHLGGDQRDQQAAMMAVGLASGLHTGAAEPHAGSHPPTVPHAEVTTPVVSAPPESMGSVQSHGAQSSSATQRAAPTAGQGATGGAQYEFRRKPGTRAIAGPYVLRPGPKPQAVRTPAVIGGGKRGSGAVEAIDTVRFDDFSSPAPASGPHASQAGDAPRAAVTSPPGDSKAGQVAAGPSAESSGTRGTLPSRATPSANAGNRFDDFSSPASPASPPSVDTERPTGAMAASLEAAPSESEAGRVAAAQPSGPSEPTLAEPLGASGSSTPGDGAAHTPAVEAADSPIQPEASTEAASPNGRDSDQAAADILGQRPLLAEDDSTPAAPSSVDAASTSIEAPTSREGFDDFGTAVTPAELLPEAEAEQQRQVAVGARGTASGSPRATTGGYDDLGTPVDETNRGLKTTGSDVGGSTEAEPVKQLGGAHKDVKGDGDRYHAHHTPANSASPHPTGDGPAIAMLIEDHKQTASYDSKKGSALFRAKQKELIDSGRFRDAVQMDIDDIRSKFGSSYDEGIKQMLEYAEGKGYFK